jgi:hypothetical protein
MAMMLAALRSGGSWCANGSTPTTARAYSTRSTVGSSTGVLARDLDPGGLEDGGADLAVGSLAAARAVAASSPALSVSRRLLSVRLSRSRAAWYFEAMEAWRSMSSGLSLRFSSASAQ